MGDGGGTPDEHRQQKAPASPEPVDHTAHDKKPHGIRDVKREYDVAVTDLAPAQLALQNGFQQRDDLPVHVVDGGGEEEQRTDGPPSMSYMWFLVEHQEAVTLRSRYSVSPARGMSLMPSCSRLRQSSGFTLKG